MRRLTILSVAYSLAPVGPNAVGGSEQVLTALDRALADAGHRNIVVACEGSEVAGELVSFPAPPMSGRIDGRCRVGKQRAMRRLIGEILAREKVDLVHMHGLDFNKVLPPPGVPVLATLHLPYFFYPWDALWPQRPDTWTHCVSASQMRDCPPSHLMLPPIPNGVPVEELGRLRPRRSDYALMLARVCPEKGLNMGLDAARLAGSPLLLAGEVFPYASHQEYFHNEVAPRLNRQRRYLGPVGFKRKRRLLAAARCLLIPSQVPETSSLVAMEAAACGTPVIAFRAGALPEVVEDGRTGILVDSTEEMADAIGRIGAINPEACRETARRRFTVERMAAAYLDRYQSMVQRQLTWAA